MTGAAGTGGDIAPSWAGSSVGRCTCKTVTVAVAGGTGSVTVTWLRCTIVGSTELGCEGHINLVVYVQGRQLTTGQVTLATSRTCKAGTPVTSTAHI